MRPLRLDIEGFGTFRDRTEVDFTELDLIAFVGPTGSGKSTVIDAITFALYGSVARYDNAALVAPVIHQLSTEARVRFDFEVAGRTYTAVRVVRRMKPKNGAPRASTREARLEAAGVDGGESTVLAGSVAELDDEVVRLIGLDFKQFTRTIVLPQGDFAEFLTDDPSDRQKLLRRLLDIDIYARMGARAREEAARAGQEIDFCRPELDRLAGATNDALAEAVARVITFDRFAVTAADLVGRLETIEADLVGRRERVNEIDARLAALAAVGPPEELGAAASIAAGAKEAMTAAEAELTAARGDRDTAADELAAVGDRAELRSRLDRRRQLVEVEEEAAKVASSRESSLASLADHRRELDGLRGAVEAADDALRQARSAVDVAPWRARLRVGEACPICTQTVTTALDHDEHDPDDRLATAEQAVATAGQALADARAAEARLDGRIESLDADLERHRTSIETLTSELDGVASETELRASIERATAAGALAEEASTRVRAAEATVAEAAAELRSAEESEATHRVLFTAQRDAVADLKPPTPEGASLVEEWQALAAWAAASTTDLQAERVEVATEGKELATTKGDLLERMAAEAGPLGVAAEPAGIVAAVASARATAQAEVDRLREQLARRSELETRVEAATETKAVNDALGRQHLSAAGFERWLLTEALDDIVARATERLFELSNGRFSLEAVDGSFSVRDHGNADERRDVRTLSGGEVFLASLSLALALASSIAELAPVDSPRLESIFLDEGFGTLDGETLDVLASAIEELSADGRLVAIVTHVRELAERMPVRFEVRKGPTTSTIERSES